MPNFPHQRRSVPLSWLLESSDSQSRINSLKLSAGDE
jgi:hypothetical protein